MEFSEFIHDWVASHCPIDLRTLYGVILCINKHDVIESIWWVEDANDIYKHIHHDTFRDPIPHVSGLPDVHKTICFVNIQTDTPYKIYMYETPYSF